MKELINAMAEVNDLNRSHGVSQRGGKKYTEVFVRVEAFRKAFGTDLGIDTNISDRYELLEKGDSNYGLPECCPVDQVFKKDTLSEGEGN